MFLSMFKPSFSESVIGGIIDPCPDASCVGRCGRYATHYACFCDLMCRIYKDCCHDYTQVCVNKGGVKNQSAGQVKNDEDHERSNKITESHGTLKSRSSGHDNIDEIHNRTEFDTSEIHNSKE